MNSNRVLLSRCVLMGFVQAFDRRQVASSGWVAAPSQCAGTEERAGANVFANGYWAAVGEDAGGAALIAGP